MADPIEEKLAGPRRSPPSAPPLARLLRSVTSQIRSRPPTYGLPTPSRDSQLRQEGRIRPSAVSADLPAVSHGPPPRAFQP